MTSTSTRYPCCWMGCEDHSRSFYAGGFLCFCPKHARAYEECREVYALSALPRRERLRRRIARLLAPEVFDGRQ